MHTWCVRRRRGVGRQESRGKAALELVLKRWLPFIHAYIPVWSDSGLEYIEEEVVAMLKGVDLDGNDSIEWKVGAAPFGAVLRRGDTCCLASEWRFLPTALPCTPDPRASFSSSSSEKILTPRDCCTGAAFYLSACVSHACSAACCFRFIARDISVCLYPIATASRIFFSWWPQHNPFECLNKYHAQVARYRRRYLTRRRNADPWANL